MRTLLNEIKEIEDQLTGNVSPGDALLFEARLLLDQQLMDKLHLQQSAYAIIQQYGRKNLKAELNAIYTKMTKHPEHRGFMQKMRSLFNR